MGIPEFYENERVYRIFFFSFVCPAHGYGFGEKDVGVGDLARTGSKEFHQLHDLV